MTSRDEPPRGEGNRFFRLFLVVFVLALVGTGIWGSVIVRQVFRDATRTDDQLRLAGWAVLAYADRHEGAFPVTTGELLSTPYTARLDRDGLEASSVDGWPESLDGVALTEPVTETTWRMRLAEATDWVTVEFQADPLLPPTVTAGGRPSSTGTLDAVNGWIRAYSEAVAERAEASGASPPVE